ncbi:MAG TPA: hypothetical protein VNZ22_18615 [Bacillota bacterium]|nr:hypothetical protein [Bacillota bacterium]
MLTQLATVKSRLALPDPDPTYDQLLTNAIAAVSARFDRECRRTFARTVNATHEFDPHDTELLVPCYPIESVAKFELKYTESAGWLEHPAIDYIVRRSCIISLPSSIVHPLSSLCIARVTYTGGYLLPGAAPDPGQIPLPPDLEHAAVEQVAYWFQKKDHLGLKTYWPSGVAYQQFADLDLLQPVRTILRHYERYTL